jgi:hypothetical protein
MGCGVDSCGIQCREAKEVDDAYNKLSRIDLATALPRCAVSKPMDLLITMRRLPQQVF